ncbi:hypothetical protein Glove_103g142 [Diversispora epigaea]|uniref:Uncharacterized protein n=1 Tax=Diversispora epigaea TaxID=1348612 RepID=A0A397J3K1_9GLOM|nr:hypothetical protein Glove_103g142 [Diversispora epigaea]
MFKEGESFYQMLGIIRMRNLTENIVPRMQQKIHEYNLTDKVLDTAQIIGYRNIAYTIH